MFFNNMKELPEHIKDILPVNWQKLYLNEFNTAYKSYKNTTIAHKIAWGAIETVYPKDKRRIKVKAHEM